MQMCNPFKSQSVNELFKRGVAVKGKKKQETRLRMGEDRGEKGYLLFPKDLLGRVGLTQKNI